tara:strand:- start:1745 stop:2917 length:1173 start_codon:yes stop_codon:yes gene_type:complete
VESPSVEISEDLFEQLNNKDLTIKDFYPKIKKELPIKILKEMIFKHKLFHQILPKFGDGYLGLVWHEPKMVGIYSSNSLKSDSWELIPNSIPKNMLRPVFMTFDKDRKLMVIFEESNTFNVHKFHLYKKEEVDLNSSFKFIDKFRVISCFFDTDDILVGIDEQGNWFKKSNKDLTSKWNKISLSFTNIPMRKLMFDYRSKYMFGLGQDFRIYKKRGSNWLNEEWDTVNGPTKKTLGGTLKDIWFDYDGILLGLSRLGLVKQKTSYYLSDFKSYSEEVTKKEISIYKVLYGSTGISVFGNKELNNNSNNVYVEGKKISEYKFKDPRLNKYLKHRMNMKKKCRNLKAMKIKQDEENKEVDDDIRNDRFMRILNEQKDTIDNLMDTIGDLRNK